MRFVERVILFLFPQVLLRRTKWEFMWQQQEILDFRSNARIFFAVASLAYVLHYFTVDRLEGLAPSNLWMTYRFGMAILCAACLGFYLYPRTMGMRLHKMPLILTCTFICYMQTQTILWYAKVPYLYSFAGVLISVMVLRTNTINSMVFGAAVLGLISPMLRASGQSVGMILSASTITMVFIVFMKAKYVSDLNLFIANQTNLDSQRQVIEINLEFTNQIKSFLPAEISRRLLHFVQEQRMSVLQAMDEVLRPRRLEITCLFSDIRGFTKASGDLTGFVAKSLLPNVKASTIAAERFSGIARKIGDLLFAYYDHEDFEMNLINVVRTAVEISNINHELNQQLPVEIRLKRYILLSGGEAIVGNISGYDSTIEITAIGSPVNLLSRLDELTKDVKLRERLSDGDILFSPNISERIESAFPGIQFRRIELSELSLKIRDFPEISAIYVLPVTKANFEIIFKNRANDDFELHKDAA